MCTHNQCYEQNFESIKTSQLKKKKSILQSKIAVHYMDVFSHYENVPIYYTDFFFSGVKTENFNGKVFLLNTFVQTIDCECTLEPPRRGDSNEYPQSMI